MEFCRRQRLGDHLGYARAAGGVAGADAAAGWAGAVPCIRGGAASVGRANTAGSRLCARRALCDEQWI